MPVSASHRAESNEFFSRITALVHTIIIKFGTKLAGQTTSDARVKKRNYSSNKIKYFLSNFLSSILPSFFHPSFIFLSSFFHSSNPFIGLNSWISDTRSVNAFSVSSSWAPWMRVDPLWMMGRCSAFVCPERWPPPLTEPRREPNREERGGGAAIPNPIPVKRVNDSDAREYACEILRWNAKFAPLSISLATSGLIFKRRVI